MKRGVGLFQGDTGNNIVHRLLGGVFAARLEEQSRLLELLLKLLAGGELRGGS